VDEDGDRDQYRKISVASNSRIIDAFISGSAKGMNLG
jgi:hypothetical protein